MRPKISIVLPIYGGMKNGEFFFWRAVNSIMDQTFKDYELVITREGTMPENTNAGIRRSRGELIKILYQDDYLAHPDALKDIVESFKGHWLITAADNNPNPHYTQDIVSGNNRLGSPSALTILNQDPLFFDEDMTWMLDCDYYKRMYDKFGEPIILNKVGVNIGVGDHQMTHILTDGEKELELRLIKHKHEE